MGPIRVARRARRPVGDDRDEVAVAFKARRIFAGGFFASGRLELFFDLPEPVPGAERDRRFRAVWQQGRRLWTHRLAIQTVDEIDDRLAGWLDQSWRTYSLPPSER